MNTKLQPNNSSIQKSSQRSFSLAEIAQHINGEIIGEVIGDSSHTVSNITPLEQASSSDLSFLFSTSLREYSRLKAIAKTCQAGAILVAKQDSAIAAPQIVCAHPLLAVAKLAPLFRSKPVPSIGINPKAEIAESARISPSARIAAFVVIGENVVIGDNTAIFPHAVIYDGATVGSNCVIHSHAVIREDVLVGDNCLIQNGAVIGGDGFGYIPIPKAGLERIPHIGTVVLQSNVDIGANATIDRATFGQTVVGNGTKIDNLVMVGHNTVIGEHSILCGHVGVSGSCQIGNGVILGGKVGVADHVHIADGVRAAAGSGIAQNIDEKKDVAGYPAQNATDWKRDFVMTKKLHQILKKITRKSKDLESLLQD